MLAPTWLDKVIETAMVKGDPKVVAQAIANSPQLIDAIKRGLADKPQPGVMGPSHAQKIRAAVQEALAATA